MLIILRVMEVQIQQSICKLQRDVLFKELLS